MKKIALIFVLALTFSMATLSCRDEKKQDETQVKNTKEKTFGEELADEAEKEAKKGAKKKVKESVKKAFD